MKKRISLILALVLCIPVFIVAASPSVQNVHKWPVMKQKSTGEDLDPLVDLAVTVEIQQIRSLEKTAAGTSLPISKIDTFSDPDFYVKVIIDNQVFKSPVWRNMKYVYYPSWSATANVPDDVEWVNITIQLWDKQLGLDKLCDISDNSQNFIKAYDVDLQYSLKTGHWIGDDWLPGFWGGADPSGYGRLNGCDDNSYYQNDRDCEMLFNIYQDDYDHDLIPYWTEVNVFHTDPTVNNIGEDLDHDGVPIEWEFKWGYYPTIDWENETLVPAWRYDPNVWEDHLHMDDDQDGLSNVDEARMASWGADPFRKDLFVELDQMQAGPNGEPANILPEGAKELLRTAYDQHNVVYHLDDGSMPDSGSEMIPFDNLTTMNFSSQNNDLQTIYQDYFLHGDPHNWRRDVFHYGVVIYQCSMANGNAFGANRFQISYKGLSDKVRKQHLDRDIVFASA
ncbi:MAG TPA: hypothetical protein VMT57_00900, partial [Candidatus Thermoplasmatota archaeon]|nr:hypothetical protein [Candidatus Thermoplasmatota archaeon]